jgi:hypothetical protein
MALVFGPGLALNLYPAELLKYGAKQIGSEPEPVSAELYFLCLSADATGGLWTPLHPTRGMDREPIPEDAKTGFPEFVRGLSFYSINELWQLPHKATHKASAVARDRSGPKQSNRVSGRWMPTLAMFPGAKATS